MDIKRLLKEKGEGINAALDGFLPKETEKPQTIHAAMRYSVFAGGKRIRPVLTLLSCGLCGGRDEDAMPAACAIELIHTYSLIHDDLPAMDNDDFRRGKPSSHKKFGEAIAILAGDALLTYAFEIVSKTGKRRVIPELVKRIAKAAGTDGMVGGQVVDIESAGKKADPETLDYLHRKKTAAIITVSAVAGGICAEANDVDIAKLEEYGNSLGLVFQIVDDILDCEGKTETLGKTAGKDKKAGKLTYPSLYGLEKAKEEAKRLTEKAKSSIFHFGEKGAVLKEIAKLVLERTS